MARIQSFGSNSNHIHGDYKHTIFLVLLQEKIKSISLTLGGDFGDTNDEANTLVASFQLSV